MKLSNFFFLVFTLILTFIIFSSFRDLPDDPPDGFTGSSGVNCSSCHTNGTNFGGNVAILGLPTNITPSTAYSLTVTTTKTTGSCKKTGFQLNVLDENGNVAGTLSTSTPKVHVSNGEYLENNDTQSFISTSGTATKSWAFLWTSPATSNANNITFYASSVIGDGKNGQLGDQVVSTSITKQFNVPTSLLVNAKIFLSQTDTLTGLMEDYIKTLSNFPMIDPYSNAGAYNGNFTHINNPIVGSTTSSVLNITGDNSVVDWVFLELRQGVSGSTNVVQTRSGLLQRDGDIVSLDGISPISFNAPIGDYYISIRHRNHLGIRTANFVTLSTAPIFLNFTNLSTFAYGSSPLIEIGTSGYYTLNGGDANSDGSVDAFDTIDWEQENGLFDDYTTNSDYSLDGSVDAFDSIFWGLNNGKFQELD